MEASQTRNGPAAEILSLLPSAVYSLDRSWRITFFNFACERYFGVRRDDVLGRDVRAVLPAPPPLALDIIAAALAGAEGEAEFNSVVNGRTMLLTAVPLADGCAVTFRDLTEKRVAQESARASAAELQTIYESAPVGLALLDEDLRYLRANRALAEINGLPVEQHIGRTVYEVVPGVAAEVAAPFRQVLQSGDPISDLEVSGETLATPGRVRTWIENIAPVHSADGKFRAVLVSVLEITARKEQEAQLRAALEARAASEEALRNSLERLRLAQEAAGLGLWDWDLASNEVTWSEGYRRVWGLPDKAPASWKSFLAGLAEQDRELVEREARAAVERGSRYDAEYRKLERDGSVRWISSRGEVIKNESGEAVRMIGVCWDATQRRRVEEALRQSEEHLKAVFNHAAVGIVEIDAEGRYLRVNRAMCDLSGYESHELVGRSFTDFTHPTDLGGDLSHHQEHVAGSPSPYHIEKRYFHRQGHWIWVSVAATPVFDDRGRFQYSVRVIEDITSRKQAEDQAKLLLNELNHRVKNTLATVQAVAAQTLRSHPQLGEFKTAFEGRLLALSKTHDLLTSGNWGGADLDKLLALELAPYAAEGRHSALGEPIQLTSAATLALGLVVHELATNAAKYGALSDGSGRLDVLWRLEGLDLVIEWKETGGPPVQPVNKTGFGSRLMQRSIAGDLGGVISLDYRPEGLACTIRFPARGNVIPHDGHTS